MPKASQPIYVPVEAPAWQPLEACRVAKVSSLSLLKCQDARRDDPDEPNPQRGRLAPAGETRITSGRTISLQQVEV